MTLTRRRIVAGFGALATAATTGLTRESAGDSIAAATSDSTPLAVPRGVAPEQVARDERFWATVATEFRVSPDFVNLENGYYGIMPEPVRRAYHRNVDHLNARNSHLLRTAYKGRADEIRDRIAGLLGVSREEIALTRGGTEALQNLISGYRRLRGGDTVLYADLDYPAAQHTMNWLAEQRGARVARLAIPEPATYQAVLTAYERALREHPTTKLLLLSHMNNRTGLVTPARQIIAMARKRGVDVILDAAHSWGQLDFTLADLDADFAAFSLHKWMGAPLGSGFLYIRKPRLPDIAPVFADESYPVTDIRCRVHSGTMDVAAILTVPAALDFHQSLGGKLKQARLRYLRERWVHQVRDIATVQILTPDDPAMYGTITAFRLSGRTSPADNLAITDHLMAKHRLYTVARSGMTGGDAVRVTPALYTSAADVDRLARALREIALNRT